MHQHVRDGDMPCKQGGNTFEALAQEAFLQSPQRLAVERERLKRQPRRLAMAPAGTVRMRGKR